MSKAKLWLLTVFSTVYGGILALVAAFFLLNWSAHWNQLASINKFWIVFIAAWSFILPTSGLIYIVKNRRVFGIIHAILMFAVASVGLFQGLTTLFNKSVAGGEGPDANPVAGIIYLAGLALTVAGGLAGICGVAVIRCVFTDAVEGTTESTPGESTNN